MVVFSRLPDVCQLAIFKQLPPKRQLRARTVCRKWDTLVPVAASTRRSLILIFGELPFPLEWASFDGLQPFITIEKPEMCLLTKEDGSTLFPPEDKATTWNSIHDYYNLQQIASTFTGISTLKVILTSEIERSEHLEMVTTLLQLWQHQLTSFQLIEFYRSNLANRPEPYPFYAAINSLFHLKRLLLYLNRLPQFDLSVISHLEELDIFIKTSHSQRLYNDQSHFMKMLQKYGESNRDLARVGYTYVDTPSGYRPIWEPFTSLDGHLRQAFTRLEVNDSISNSDLSTVCNHFCGLMSLKVHYTIESYGLVPLFHELSKLKQLVYLSLATCISEIPLPNAHHRLEQLLSVKALVLKLSPPTPQHMAALDIGWIFPNLQVITYHPGNGNFFYGENYVPRGTLQPAKEWLRQVFRPLKRRFGRQLIIRRPFCNICSAEELLAAM